MFRRKLLALGYPQPDSFNTQDENQFRSIIVWLEDQKIRHYKIEERASLRSISSPDWVKALHSYLMDLECPYQQSEKNCVIEWLLAYAVRLEYGDNVDKYKGVTAETLTQAVTKPAPGVSSNPLDNLNFDDPDFKAGIASLSVLLQIPPHQDHVEMLKAICLLVKNKLSKEAIEQVSKDTGKVEHIALDQMELGFDTGDYIINEAAKVLRLIHLHDLRELQTTINQAIVGVQNVTANPKTDSRLGKVGR
ncbi:hypothetical protein CHS0354_001876 [Potamilus streckersoni]|uniref:RNA transcription, translation and transport factor protein n=1 Tax=Potamilus streckersoni TaxID=2493646 RepID=A0AAE0TF88_9BIVA|nr:hypothetical protein CHS0354_001876 [Potamilus streckersoni]